MLFAIDGDEIKKIPHRREYDVWRKNISDCDYAKILIKINEIADSILRASDSSKNGVVVSSHVPQESDWTGTVYEPIWHACKKSHKHSGYFLGLIVWKFMMDQDEKWMFKNHAEDDYGNGKTYWRYDP